LEVPLKTEESYYLQWAARAMSERVSGGTAEIHAQVGVNISACPNNCLFCSFARANNVFNQKTSIAPREIIRRCAGFEKDGANAIYLMATADFPFQQFLALSAQVKEKLKKETMLIANIGDIDCMQARLLKQAGFTGIYHALRMGEGTQTAIEPRQRLETFRAAREAGLLLGTCVEPIGPEHCTEELVEKILFARRLQPVYSGAARRIPIPGTKLAAYGMVSEAKMAHILAVVRLATGGSVRGNCTHEPNGLGATAGSNLFWAESGSNPRDKRQKPDHNRGFSVNKCKELFNETEWAVLDGPSRFFLKCSYPPTKRGVPGGCF
jgi:biotin synthase